ncbi:MAG: hypothetical protein WBY93_14270, partial [Candidatus Binatus sp.]
TNLFEAIKGGNFVAYPDDDIRLAVSRCVAIETSRGWRIAKEKASHKIDVIVALAQAALGAVQQGQVSAEYAFIPLPKIDKYRSSPLAIDRLPGEGRRQAENRVADAGNGHLRKRFGKWSGY